MSKNKGRYNPSQQKICSKNNHHQKSKVQFKAEKKAAPSQVFFAPKAIKQEDLEIQVAFLALSLGVSGR